MDSSGFRKSSQKENDSSVEEIMNSPAFLNWLRREARVESVRFGLNAVKNVGGNAVDAIIDVREEKGKLVDFLDFLKAVDLNRLNRRMLKPSPIVVPLTRCRPTVPNLMPFSMKPFTCPGTSAGSTERTAFSF